MGDLKLFKLDSGAATEIAGSAATVEKSLQELIERNLESFLGVRILASEHITGKVHGGRIDTLGIDENDTPVIVEYKRATSENVINQGLFYLDWLDHRAEFQLLVQQVLGAEVAGTIDWSAPRVICIAGNFTRYDEHAVQQMGRNIELLRYRRFGDDLLALELVNAPRTAGAGSHIPAAGKSSGAMKTVAEQTAQASPSLRQVFDDLRSFVLAFGDDVQEKEAKYYVAFRRIRNFACIEVHAKSEELLVFVKVDPETVELESGFTRDVREIGHFGTGDLEIRIRDQEALDRAKPLLQRSYDAS